MDAKRLEELFVGMPEGKEIQFSGKCHYCGKDVTVTARKTPEGFQVEGGAVYEPDRGSGKFWVQCDECFQSNPVLADFRPCEVYSRVVGYLRPVSQWNDGKQAEFAMRKTFDKAVGA